MFKKNKIAQTDTADVKAENTAQEEKQEKVKIVKAKKAAKKPARPNIFKRMWKKLRETFSELKKVTWPTFPTVLKQTGVVIAVVSFFLIIIFAFDFLLSLLYGLLIQ